LDNEKDISFQPNSLSPVSVRVNMIIRNESYYGEIKNSHIKIGLSRIIRNEARNDVVIRHKKDGLVSVDISASSDQVEKLKRLQELAIEYELVFVCGRREILIKGRDIFRNPLKEEG